MSPIGLRQVIDESAILPSDMLKAFFLSHLAYIALKGTFADY